MLRINCVVKTGDMELHNRIYDSMNDHESSVFVVVYLGLHGLHALCAPAVHSHKTTLLHIMTFAAVSAI